MVTLHHVKIPLRRPFGHVLATRDHAEAIVLILERDGVLGVGECVPRSYVTGETFDSVWDALRGIDIAAVWARVELGSPQAFVASVEALRLPQLVGGLAAACAVELAILDVGCKLNAWRLAELAFAMGLPTAMLGETSEIISVPLDMCSEPRDLAHLVGTRLGNLKIKVGGDLARDVARVRECREIFGASLSMCVDANMAWTVEQAARAGDALGRFDIRWYEEPLQKSERVCYRELRERTGIRIMLDESACGFEQTRNAIESQWCDLINIRLSKCGGFLASLRLAELASRSNIAFQHGTQVGQLGFLNAAGRHFTSTVKGIVACEGGPGLANLQDFPTQTKVELDWNVGHLVGISGVGIGVAPDPAKLQKYSIRSRRQ